MEGENLETHIDSDRKFEEKIACFQDKYDDKISASIIADTYNFFRNELKNKKLIDFYANIFIEQGLIKNLSFDDAKTVYKRVVEELKSEDPLNLNKANPYMAFVYMRKVKELKIERNYVEVTSKYRH